MRTSWEVGDLVFRYMRVSEVPRVAEILAKPSVCADVYFGPNKPEETEAYFGPVIEAMQAALSREELPAAHVFAILRGGEFIGNCALEPLPYSERHFNLGYQLDEPWWRRGYGTQAADFVLWYSLSVLKARRLSADCLASNVGSTRILERHGFKIEGRQRAYYHKGGRDRERVLFGLLPGDETLDLAAYGAAFES